ncbi:hypothetical protein FSP39_019615 [Pinctada imbricata]|uniref:Rho guanine nucleotide exchange factor 39 n=1 Tax=Pinctada imbricata TaxID=66713 RepID=A0AA88YQ79_PINIB|nr:hypothetical protein FSP39_019615 [Pinctada imbricata]
MLTVLSEIAEEELAELSHCSNGDPEVEKLQQEAKRDKRRKKITQELFETETTYLQHLELINKYYDFPLRFNCLIPENVHARIFSNIEQIMDVNKTLLEYMENTSVGEAFKFLGPFLKLYSSYANNHENAISTLQEWMQKSTDFTEFIRQQEDREDMMGLKVNALLITPVQRIPRYKLLLEDLLENTTENHHDYIQLKESVRQISEIASHINDHIKQHENFQKMLSIQKSFDSSAPKILAPGREFIKEGILRKVSRRGGKSHDRMFFLFSDMLIYGKTRFLDGGSNTYSCCCVLPLKHCQLDKVFGNAGKHNADGGGMFRLSCKDESLLLYTTDPSDGKQWMDTLETAIKKLSSNRSTLRKPSSHKVPLRGKSLWKIRKQERKQDDKVKKILNPRKEDICLGDSPCLKQGLSPLGRQLKSLSSDIDLRNCRSPNKRPRFDNDMSSTPIRTSCTRSGRPLRPLSMENDNVQSTRESKLNADLEECVFSPVVETDSRFSYDSPDVRTDRRFSTDSNVENENTFMQMTMDDIGDATVDIDSFCKPSDSKRNVESEGQVGKRKVYHTDSYQAGIDNRETCVQQPFTRVIDAGRQFRKGCKRAYISATERIQETKSNCVLQ